MLDRDGSAHSESVYISDISAKNLSQEIRKAPAVREAHDDILPNVIERSAGCLSLRH